MINLEPLDDRVLVLPDPTESSTSLITDLGDVNKIFIVKVTLGPSIGDIGTGRVVAVGKGREVNGALLPMTVAVGDRVLYSMGAGHDQPVGDVKHRMFREKELMGVLC